MGSSARYLFAGRWGRCWACIDGEFGRTTRDLSSACAVRLSPCSSSDVLTRLPSQSRGKRNAGLLEVDFLCCIPNAQALSSFIDRLSPLAFRVRGESKGRPRIPRLPRFIVQCRGPPDSCDFGVDKECYLVDPASSHMLISKIKPCMSGTKAPWHHRHRGTVAPRHRGTMAATHRGSMALRHQGTVAPRQ
ncbi:hypothetical protein FXO37_35829 [Capsicum annuum]|nr:hypothetical protein FXO37_35829 [Capsicum annuum]